MFTTMNVDEEDLLVVKDRLEKEKHNTDVNYEDETKEAVWTWVRNTASYPEVAYARYELEYLTPLKPENSSNDNETVSDCVLWIETVEQARGDTVLGEYFHESLNEFVEDLEHKDDFGQLIVKAEYQWLIDWKKAIDLFCAELERVGFKV